MDEAVSSDSRAVGGERRRVTVLFADMVEFTPTAERLGEEGAYTLMQRIYTLMATAVKEYGGTVETFTGDGIMALFGVPIALEDATLRACKAALLIHERLAAVAHEFVAAFTLHPRLRIGINAGPVVAGQLEVGRAGASGDTINFAARLESLALPGTVALSETAFRLVEGLVEATFVEERKIKGKSEPQKVYRLDRIRHDAVRFDASLSRGLTGYVGRARELEVLRHNLAASATGLRVVDLVGEPGMGKSRLLHEFLQALDRNEVVVLRGNCASDGAQTAFGLFVDIVRTSFRFSATDPKDEIARKLADGLSAVGLDSRENQDLLLNLLGLGGADDVLKGLEGTLIGLRTRALLQSLLHERCSLTPTVVVIEDLHWIDSVSEDLLGKFVATEQNLPLLVLHTRRPEYRPPWIDGRSPATLVLQRLSAEDTASLVRHRLAADALPAPLVRLVMDRADGNALFAEEITSFLVERGVLRRVGTSFEIDDGAVAGMLPPSVQSLLAARVDRLGARDRALLQAASVIGRSFDAELLAAVVDHTSDIGQGLAAGVAFDFLYVEPGSDGYVFKHALVRDALYESLLSGPRAALHLRVAEEIERRSHNRLAEAAETLAHHFGQTTRSGKAFSYVSMAGRKSLGTYALTQAEMYFSRAEALLDVTPDYATDDGFVDFLTGYVLLLQLAYEPRQLFEKIDKHRNRVARLGDRADVVVVLHYEVWALIWQCRFGEAAGVQARVTRMAEHLGDDTSHAYSEAGFFFLDALTCSPSTDITRRGEKAVAAALRSGDSYVIAWLRFMVAWNAFHRGQMTRAHALAVDLARTGSEMRDPRSTGLALWLHCWAAIASEEFEKALAYAEKTIETAITPFDERNGLNGKGTALVLLRRGEESAALLAGARAEAAEHGRWYEFTGNDVSFGVSIVLAGRLAEGVKHIETAISKRQEEGYIATVDWYRLALVQLYLDILEGHEKPPLAVILRNIVFLTRVKISGRKKLDILLHQLQQSSNYNSESMHGGRIDFMLGRFHKMRGRRDLAMTYFQKSKDVLMQFGASETLNNTAKALAALDN